MWWWHLRGVGGEREVVAAFKKCGRGCTKPPHHLFQEAEDWQWAQNPLMRAGGLIVGAKSSRCLK